jgi:AraC-like DNA-binding protein
VEWVRGVPAGRLRGLVDGYVGYRMSGFGPGVHRGLPSRHMTFIVGIGAPIAVSEQSDPAQSPDRYRCVLSGLQASPAMISHDGCQEGVAIKLSPVGCRALFGVPAGALWDLSMESSTLIGPAGLELWERLQSAHGWDARFAVCDGVLQRGLTDQAVTAELVWCWRAIVSSGGRVPVSVLADEVGYSRQHLARLFGTEFGLGPKLASRVVRFERAQRAWRASPSPVCLAEIAAACGYADQAHLTREFVDLAGCTPRQLAAEDLPILQDTARAIV